VAKRPSRAWSKIDAASQGRESLSPKSSDLIGTVRRWADDLDEIVVRLERKSRYAEKGLLIEHETER
jgi:hypothetical protein